MSHLTRRQWLATVGAAGLLSTNGQRIAAQTSGRKRPNFVFFLGEGLRPDELSYGGNRIIQTPNLDRIGREGVNFQNAFCTNALCAPARASILTGMYSHTTGAVDNRNATIPASAAVVTDLLHDAGYETAFLGKSHVAGALRNHAWDYYFGFEGQSGYFDTPIWEGGNGKYTGPKKYPEYIDDMLAVKAADWLQTRTDKPFCLFLWFYAPHAPFYRPARLDNALNGVPIPTPKSYAEYFQGYPNRSRAVLEARNRIGSCLVGSDTPRSLEEVVKDQYAGVLSNDQDAGLLFRTLQQKGMMDDTAILLSSDHGFFLGEHHFYDKRFMYEPAIRIPMSIRYPRLIPAGTQLPQMALNVDIAPTILDLAGIPAPAAMQGRSLLPLARGATVADWRQDWLYEYYEYPDFEHVQPHRGIRTARYKLIDFYLEPEQFELYDLQTDPDEMTNLYGKPEFQQLADTLRGRLAELRKQTNDNYVYKIETTRAVGIGVCGAPSPFPKQE
ncbi:MAG TPA: sulfatase [Bryobacteraceae bacterium]|jgi:arylsulfatase A-like enzyme|nr:sulfatase [Bryobacteraceae bacterium]